MKEPGYRYVDHTADIALEVWAPTQAALLREGARAVIDELTGGAQLSGTATIGVRVESMDAPDRLVVWLNEVLYHAVTEGFLYCDSELTLTADGLTGDVVGEADAADRIETELKSATYHDLVYEARDGGWFARVVIDV